MLQQRWTLSQWYTRCSACSFASDSGTTAMLVARFKKMSVLSFVNEALWWLIEWRPCPANRRHAICWCHILGSPWIAWNPGRVGTEKKDLVAGTRTSWKTLKTVPNCGLVSVPGLRVCLRDSLSPICSFCRLFQDKALFSNLSCLYWSWWCFRHVYTAACMVLLSAAESRDQRTANHSRSGRRERSLHERRCLHRHASFLKSGSDAPNLGQKQTKASVPSCQTPKPLILLTNVCYSSLVVPWASSGCHHCSIKDEDLSRSLPTTNRNIEKLHSPSISYSSYISGSRWSTCFYHSCRHSDTSGSHRSPEKRSISKHRIRNPQHSRPSSRHTADTVQHVTDGELTSMQGLMSWFRTFRAFWSIWICMDGKKQASFSQKQSFTSALCDSRQHFNMKP